MLSAARHLAYCALALCLALPAFATDAPLQSSVTASDLPKGKLTEAGLYITAAEAADALATHDGVILIDVRTPEETILTGHPVETAANIPIAMFDPGYTHKHSGSYAMRPNPSFTSQTIRFLEQANPKAVLILCRSGGRSARAVDLLIKAGVTLPLYSVVDGFEGDKNSDGRREVNGWKNSGAAWTYAARADLLIRPE